ncbi:hypothetical protein CC2G_004098 [Coprinopsis cinerea AmutBmut pab1-1]|nr:hypothetical protein CC2G_004098 [Coprinopsis cinerea AmutBmut pab1-1]
MEVEQHFAAPDISTSHPDLDTSHSDLWGSTGRWYRFQKIIDRPISTAQPAGIPSLGDDTYSFALVPYTWRHATRSTYKPLTHSDNELASIKVYQCPSEVSVNYYYAFDSDSQMLQGFLFTVISSPDGVVRKLWNIP